MKLLCFPGKKIAIKVTLFCCVIGACTSKDIAVDQKKSPLAPVTAVKRGLTEDEAQLRARQVTDVSYDLKLNIALSRTQFSGQANIKFRLVDRKLSETLRIDFSGGTVLELQVNGLSLQPETMDTLKFRTPSPKWNELSARFTRSKTQC